MSQRMVALLLFAAATASCGAPAPASAPTPSDPARRLEAILATPITFEQDARYNAFAEEQGTDIRILLPELALNRAADPLARANAVLRMGAIPMPSFDVYAQTIEDPDPRVRGATLGVVGPYASHVPQQTLPILARGLVDSEIGIQAKALQELRDRDLELLRFYISQNPPADLRDIAIQTIRNAHAWGEPLVPEADGTLRRITPAGLELVFQPNARDPEYDQMVGTLSVVRPGAEPRIIADSVESVGHVIPAVDDAEGRFVAVETARRIEIHDLQTGAVRSLGAGIAPRPLPLTPDFMYFREIDRAHTTAGERLVYEFLRAPFAAGQPVPFDSAAIVLKDEVRGYISPLRWARVVDRGTRFMIQIEGMPVRPLPSPFGQEATP